MLVVLTSVSRHEQHLRGNVRANVFDRVRVIETRRQPRSVRQTHLDHRGRFARVHSELLVSTAINE